MDHALKGHALKRRGPTNPSPVRLRLRDLLPVAALVAVLLLAPVPGRALGPQAPFAPPVAAKPAAAAASSASTIGASPSNAEADSTDTPGGAPASANSAAALDTLTLHGIAGVRLGSRTAALIDGRWWPLDPQRAGPRGARLVAVDRHGAWLQHAGGRREFLSLVATPVAR
jgi:hypothetical protein